MLAAAAHVQPLIIHIFVATAPLVTAAGFLWITRPLQLSAILVLTETALRAVAVVLRFATRPSVYSVAIPLPITAPLDTLAALWPIVTGLFVSLAQPSAATAGNTAAVYSPKAAHARLFVTATFSAIAQLFAAAQFTPPAVALSFAARFAYAATAEAAPVFI